MTKENSESDFPEGLHSETWLQDDEKSVAFISLHGINQRMVNDESTTVYEVLSGKGIFYPDDDGPIFVSPGSKVIVTPGMPYHDQGEGLTMMATSTPPFNPDAVRLV